MKIKLNKNFNKEIFFVRKAKNFFKKLYKPCLIIVGLQTIFISYQLIQKKSFIKNNIKNTIAYIVDREAPFSYTENMSSFLKDSLRDYFKYGSELLYAFITPSKLKRVDLSIPFKNITYLECTRKEESVTKNLGCYSKNKVWVNAILDSNNTKYKVKLRTKGSRGMHKLSFNKMSFKVDIRGDDRYLGMEEFSLQLPVIRGYTRELLVAEITRREGIASPRHHYVRLYINGEYVGLRHLEEAVNKELIEANNRRYGPVFSINETINNSFEKTNFDIENNSFWSNQNPALMRQTLSVLEAFKQNKDFKITNKYFDLDLWAKYFAIMDVFQTHHGSIYKSVKFFLNPTTGLIEPVFFDGHKDNRSKNFLIADLTNQKIDLKACDWLCKSEVEDYISWTKRFFGDHNNINSEFYISYLNFLEKFTSNEYIENTIKPNWETFSIERGEIYKEFSRNDNVFSYGLRPYINKWYRFKKNLKSISSKISTASISKPIIGISSDGRRISFLNNLSSLPQIVKISCGNYLSDSFILFKGIKYELDLKDFKECNLNNIFYTLNNKPNQHLIANSYSTDFLLDEEILDEFYPNDKKTQTSKVFESKKYYIDQSKKFQNLDITFEAGATICLRNSSTLTISNSNITFAGLSNKQVKIIGCDNKSGAVLIEKSKVKISNLNLIGLAAPIQPLKVLYGGLNIVNSDIYFDRIQSNNSKSEDAINFINSNVKGREIIALNSFSDAIDFDFSDFNIKNIKCSKIGNDCLDLSGSKGEINSIFGEKIKDKLVSVGEASNLKVNEIKAVNSSIGIVSKDSSVLEVISYIFNKVDLPLAAFIKKQELGSPIIKIKKTNLPIQDMSLISEDSYVNVSNNVISSGLSSKQVFENLYGKKYGVNTAR